MRSGSLFVRIGTWGVVHDYRGGYTGETPRYTYPGVRYVRYTALGEPVVTKPDWVTHQTQ